MALLKNSLIVSVWTLLSRGLGFVRDLVIANKLGAGTASDAFFIALQLPNLLRRLFAEGAFNVAFVPLLAKEKTVSTEAALAFASAAFSRLIVVVGLVVVLGEIFMPALVGLMATGWVDDVEKFNLTVALGRITFPYLGLITVAAFLGAMCNTWGKFAAYAMVPAFLNLSILLCLLALPGAGVHPAEAAAWSVPLGGIAQALYMWWAARRLGLRLTLSWWPKHKDLNTLMLRIGPATLGVGVLQLSVLIDNNIASRMPAEHVVSYLQYANRFYQLPLSLIGIAVATVLLPQLALMLSEGKKREAGGTFEQAFAVCVTLAIGAAAGLAMLSYPLLVTAFAHGKFTLLAAWASALAMVGYVSGLPGYMMTKISAPAFFAQGDARSPVKASAVALGVNLLGNLFFLRLALDTGVEAWAYLGIALSTALGGYVNAGLQLYWLRKRGFLEVRWRDLRAKIPLWTGLLAVMLGYGVVAQVYAWPFDDGAWLPVKIIWLAVVDGGYALVFGFYCHVTRLIDWPALWRDVKTARRKKATVALGGAEHDV